MTERQFYDWQTAGGGGDVLRFVEILERLEVPWCMIGGLAVNHWSQEPLATADVDVVIAHERVEQAVAALEAAGFQAERFEWSINLKGSSKVAVQISTEDFYREFPSRSTSADVHGILMRVASLQDTLAGKLVAWRDPQRRPSKRQKDLLDIMRLVESHPELKSDLPPDLSHQIGEG
jgi:Nucleotidyl transferase AbiEii toxin, Type IV TA system